MTANAPMWSGRPSALGAMKSESERQGSLPSRLACWRRKWKRSRTWRAGVVGVELDVVADGVGGEEAVDAAGGEEVFRDDGVEEGVGFGEELAGLRALLGVVEDARVNAFELPGVEEGRPVDELAQRGEREVVEDADAGELGGREVFSAPVDGGAALRARSRWETSWRAARRGLCAGRRSRRDAARRRLACRLR